MNPKKKEKKRNHLNAQEDPSNNVNRLAINLRYEEQENEKVD